MEVAISVIVGFMIIGALYAIHAKDILSAVIAGGIVGYSLVICFLMLKAPDLAIVQIVVETITLIIMVAVVLDSSREEAFQGLTGVVTYQPP
jgi:multicomponent Na+:H+ antiporter subunit A